MTVKHLLFSGFLCGAVFGFFACQSGHETGTRSGQPDTSAVAGADTASTPGGIQESTPAGPTTPEAAPGQATTPATARVSIYNFHLTKRCPSCIAIEDATRKTLETYFGDEVKQGRVKRFVLNVDEEANKKISEKFQAFGSGIFLLREFQGKELIVDLTGDGFRYAKNKEEKFIEVLKSKISALLK